MANDKQNKIDANTNANVVLAKENGEYVLPAKQMKSYVDLCNAKIEETHILVVKYQNELKRVIENRDKVEDVYDQLSNEDRRAKREADWTSQIDRLQAQSVKEGELAQKRRDAFDEVMKSVK